MPQTTTGVISLPTQKRVCWKRRLCVAVVFFSLLYVFRASLLSGYAQILTVRQMPIADVDAVVVTGEVDGADAFAAAARLYHARQVRQILIQKESPSRLSRMGVVPTFESIAEREFSTRGVPASAITILSHPNEPARDRNPLLEDWLNGNPDCRIVLFVSEFAARRSLIAENRKIDPASADRLHWRALPDRRFDTSNWWHNKQGVLTVFSESVRLAHLVLIGKPKDQQHETDPDLYENRIQQLVISGQ